MAKKKSKSLFETTDSESSPDITTDTLVPENSVVNSELNIQYENLKTEYNVLKNKFAEYVEETTAQLNSYKEQLENIPQCPPDEDAGISDEIVTKLQKQIVELRNDADKYLIKISDLTFENAKLTSQIKELENQLLELKQNSTSSQNPIQNISNNVSYNNTRVMSKDGYSAWN